MLYSFQFYNNPIFNEQIQVKVTQSGISIKDLYRLFLFKSDTSLTQFYGKRFLVKLLREARAKCLVSGHCRADNPVGQVTIFALDSVGNTIGLHCFPFF